MTKHRTISVAAATVAAFALGVPIASADAPTPFTITEYFDASVEGDPTFTATGGLCPSGTLSDDVRVFASSPVTPNAELLIRTRYTCDDGSGEFYAQKHVFIAFAEDGLTNTGPVSLMGGTGAYTKLSGHGIDTGWQDFESGLGEGHIAGVLSVR
jgi:hypothetical protein